MRVKITAKGSALNEALEKAGSTERLVDDYHWATPKRVNLFIPPIRLPTAMVMGRDQDLTGGLLIMVPLGLDIRSRDGLGGDNPASPVVIAREAINQSIPVLPDAPKGVFTEIAEGLKKLNGALQEANEDYWSFVAGDTAENLDENRYNLAEELVDKEAEDEVSSVLFVGPPGAELHLYETRNGDKRGKKGGHLLLKTGLGVHVYIRDLIGYTSAEMVDSVALAREKHSFLSVEGSAYQIGDHPDGDWNDSFSSLSFFDPLE